VVEFLEPAKPGGPEIPFPVEYKRGRTTERLPDRIQLCAQAMALEEMTGTPVPRGVLFYHSSRKRVLVEFGPDLRRQTEAIAARVRAMLEAKHVPKAVLEPKCRRCSLREVCQPAPAGREGPGAYLAALARDAGATNPK